MRHVLAETVENAPRGDQCISPIGQTADEVSAELSAADEEYRRVEEEYREIHEIARQVVHFRTLNHLTQRQLAELVGTSYSQIARLESGLHKPSVDSLQRVAHALGKRLRITLEPAAPAVQQRAPASRAEPTTQAFGALVTGVVTASRKLEIRTMLREQHRLPNFGNHRPLITDWDSQEPAGTTRWAA